MNEREGALTFLSKYNQLTSARRSGNTQIQAQLLVQLLTSKVAPKKYWQSFLYECSLLLLNNNDNPSLFDYINTIELMACLQEIDLESRVFATASEEESFGEEDGSEQWIASDQQIETVRLALTKNLARVIR
jgi:hypothetical protein